MHPSMFHLHDSCYEISLQMMTMMAKQNIIQSNIHKNMKNMIQLHIRSVTHIKLEYLLGTPQIRWPANGIIAVADVLGPNWPQAISNRYADSTVTVVIPESYHKTHSISSYSYQINSILQRTGGLQPIGLLLLPVSSSHQNSALFGAKWVATHLF